MWAGGCVGIVFFVIGLLPDSVGVSLDIDLGLLIAYVVSATVLIGVNPTANDVAFPGAYPWLAPPSP